MQRQAMDVDVLIVGAGPVGLFLANECARRGLRWRLVEARAAQSEHSKALAIFPRTLEIFDMAGVVAPFLEAANRVTKVAVVSHGHPLAHIRFAPEETPYPFIAMVPQNLTERLLVEQLRARGGEVEYQTAFVSAEPLANGVRVTLDHRGESVTSTASFVVGCDGAHSGVRHAVGLTLEGGEYQAAFMLADIETNEVLAADELQLCPSELGPVAIFPMSASRRRMVATVDRPEGDAPSLELVQRILRERAPRGLEARALHWSSYFRIHHRRVARLRSGRIFLAGDAAHIHSPFGGQGMNTGLHDAWNLAWKLDLALRGHGGEQLLESYTAERIPIIQQVVEMTDILTRVMGTPNRLVQALRDVAIPMVSRLAPFQHAFVQRLSELGVAYPGSPIIEGPGKRFLEDSMRGGDGILSRFLLLIGAETGAATREGAKRLCEAFDGVVEPRPSGNPGITLVRPDGYIAFAGAGDAKALAAVRALLERNAGPTDPVASAEVPAGAARGAARTRT
jgi:2-polyprenyl-6-methoxyphenol hydroxylase-like FAD-dependent oxidoreductase